MTYLLYLLIIVLIITIFRVITSIVFSLNESRMQKARTQELEDQSKKKIKDKSEDEEQMRQIINKITAPLADNVLSKRPIKNVTLLKRKLRIAGWDKYFTPIQWVAFRTILQIIGTIFALLFVGQSKMFAGIFFLFFAVMPNFLLNNSYNNRTEQLLLAFPETINIVYGYLTAGMTMQKAFEETAKNASPEWKVLLETFIAKCNTTDMLDALDWLKEEVAISEAREFFATVKLSLELGGSAKTGFEEQADRIQQLLRDAMQKKIEARKVWATIVQGPILLLVMGSFALPLVGTMADIF